MAACLAAVEAEEALLQIYALQWRAIDLRAQQLRAECRRVALDEEIDREERELLREHEQLLRMREKQLAQQKYEDAFALRAEVRRLRRQSDALQQRHASQTDATADSAAKATGVEHDAHKSKKKKTVATKRSDKMSSSDDEAVAKKTTTTTATVPKKKEAASKKSVAFSPRKPPAPAPGARPPRSLERSFDEEVETETHEAQRGASATKTAADELMQMLSQDRGSESEGDAVSFADLMPPALSAGGRSPTRSGSATGTPSKFTPSKLARKVVKKAMAAPMDFDFTRKAALAKAKAAKEKALQKSKDSDDDGEDDSGDDDDARAEPETPSKNALRRRKDLGISFADKPVNTRKTPVVAVATVSTGALAMQSNGGKSLMQMVGAASLVVKPKETTATSEAQAKKQPAEQTKARQKKDKPESEKATTTATISNQREPEGEDFARLHTANITKRVKTKKTTRENAPTASSEPEDEDAIAEKTTAKSNPPVKKKSAVEQAIAKASLLTRMTSMQDIATPKVAGKKTTQKKPSTTSLAAKRAEFQKILSEGMSALAPAAKDSDGDDAEAEEDAFATPQKPSVMKRKRAEDAPPPPAQALPPQTNYLQSPSVSALLAMRPSKSPIGIRYVPKTLKTPQMVVRKRPRSGQEGSEPVGDAASSDVAPPRASARPQRQVSSAAAARGGFTGVASALASAGGSAWSSSGPSFFDKFVNDGGLRLKRTAKP